MPALQAIIAFIIVAIIRGSCRKLSIGRHGGLMASAQDSGSSGPGLTPGQGLARVTVLCSWARHFTLIVHVPLYTQVYKWVPAT